MAPFDIVWSAIPNNGSGLVTTFVNPKGVFVGNNGFVWRVDYWTGTILETNTLSGAQFEEVRFAAPLDASVLAVGTNGYVFALDPTTLETSWSVNLPNAGSNITDVICSVDSIYAGSNGYVYRLDIVTGEIIASNPLTGMGNYEVRLGITQSSSPVLVAGINGEALGMDMKSLVITWKNGLPGSGYDVTSVLGGNGVAYAACGGHIYQIDESSGSTLNQNGLVGVDSYEVRMTMDTDQTHLYLGTNGYAVGLRPDTLATVYSTSLPGSGYSVTSVAAGMDTAYYANNGYVYQVDSNGVVVAQNPLTGFGKSETRLSVDQNASGQLFVGLNGKILTLALGDYPPSYGGWMGQMADQIGSTPLRSIAIPGTHDSGTYGVSAFSYIASDDLQILKPIEVLGFSSTIIKYIAKNWCLTQTLDFAHQLSAGIRYFDLRVEMVGLGQFSIVHGLVSVTVDEMLKQVRKFLARPGNDKEIVLLDFNHFYNFDPSAHRALVNLLQLRILNQMVPASAGQNVTPNDIWSTSDRIITFYSDAYTVAQYPLLWPSSRIQSPWPNMNNANDVLSYLDGVMKIPRSTFFVLQGVITPDGSTVSQGLLPFTDNPDSLLELAETINSGLVSRLQGWKGQGVNIVIADYFNWSPSYVDTIVKLNAS